MSARMFFILIKSIVSSFVTTYLPRTDGTKQVSRVSCVATSKLLSIDEIQYFYPKYSPRFVGIVACSA